MPMIRDMHASSWPVVTAMRQPLLPVAALGGNHCPRLRKHMLSQTRDSHRLQSEKNPSGPRHKTPQGPDTSRLRRFRKPVPRRPHPQQLCPGLVAELVPKKFTG